MKKVQSPVVIFGLVIGLAFAGLGLSGCATVPVTGRTQLALVSPTQELQLGLASFEQMKQELKVSTDPQANALVQRVGQQIAAVADPDMPHAQWEFVVFESEEPNAFCLPGGKVGIFTGILPITQDEAGLATVIGHEVAHAVARHGGERLSEAMVMQTGGQLLGATMAQGDPRWQMAAATAFGLGSQLGRALPHSRAQEAEADYIGLIYMARAGYNPQAAISFWERFAAASGPGGAPWFLRTHPVTEDRIQSIREAMPAAMAEYQTSRLGP
jgi:metalloendopeptidase OMA1, mitochondrial